MAQVQYTGHASGWTFEEEDFTRHGITDQGAVAFTDERGDGNVQSISEAAWAYLKEHHSADFALKDSEPGQDITEEEAAAKAEAERLEAEAKATADAEAAAAAEKEARRGRPH